MSGTPCDGPPPAEGGFRVREDGSWAFEGALTFDNAAQVMAQSAALPVPRNGRIDVSGLAAADSSALAVLLALKRRGTAERHKVHVVGLPQTLVTLCGVYGVGDLLDA